MNTTANGDYMETPWRKPAHHYVSPFNFAPEIVQDIKVRPGERVQFYDSTLRKALNEEIERRLNAKPNYPCWIEEVEVERICRDLAAG